MSDLIKTLDAKWLDPECHEGCISLLLKNQITALAKDRDLMQSRLTAAEKENARLNHIQENGNPKLSIAIAELCGWSWDTKVPGAWHKDGKGWCHVLPSIPDMFAELKEKCDKAETRVKELEREADSVLCDVSQLLDGWHSDGTSWTEWDESVRNRVSELHKKVARAELDKLKGKS